MDTETKNHSAQDSIIPAKNKRTQKNIHKLPKSTFALYVKLYCNKKETKSLKHTSKMIEATKSWLTLSEIEKQKFHIKFKEMQQKYANKVINCLHKSEPFMKKKVSSRTQNGHLILSKDCVTTEDDNNETKLLPLENYEQNLNKSNIEEQKTEVQDDPIDTQYNEMEDADVESHEPVLEQSTKITYPEPLHPSLKSGKELFEVIQSTTKIESTWTSLPQKERSLYNQAVLNMKKDYIQKYKQYLEGLTQEELFDHYNKCFH